MTTLNNHVVSFSGGRTSAYLVHLMEQKRKKEGWNVEYIFLDTGAEHPKTYEFIRNVAQHWKVPITCIRAKIANIPNVGPKPEVISLNEIGCNFIAWDQMLLKYGEPFQGGAFCTRTMKTQPNTKYCEAKYGKGNFYTWLGIRADEPKRLKQRKNDPQNIRYLAEISDAEKSDILAFWEKQPFDLQIPEWLGNCVFCLKKNVNKVALAVKDEPELAERFGALIQRPANRSINKEGRGVMYRGKLTLEGIANLYAEQSRAELVEFVTKSKQLDTGSCSESCEIFT